MIGRRTAGVSVREEFCELAKPSGKAAYTRMDEMTAEDFASPRRRAY